MLTLPPGVRVFVATDRVDGRKGMDGLSALVRSRFAKDPLSGTLLGADPTLQHDSVHFRSLTPPPGASHRGAAWVPAARRVGSLGTLRGTARMPATGH